jgi:predicted branched-subunit amino acid permease
MMADQLKNEALTPAREFLDGMRDETPLILGVFPFGVVFGVLGVEAGMDPLAVFFMSSIVFGGASQIIFAQMASAGTGFFIIAGTVGVVNLRHVLYSATMVEYLSHLPLRWKVLLSYLLTDEAFVISNNRMQNRPRGAHMHYHLLGTGMTLWTSWQIATLAGIIIGAAIPPSLGLSFAIPLTFLAIAAPQIKYLPNLIAFATAGCVALLGQNLLWNTGVIVAAITGIIGGALAEKIFAGKTAA